MEQKTRLDLENERLAEIEGRNAALEGIEFEEDIAYLGWENTSVECYWAYRKGYFLHKR